MYSTFQQRVANLQVAPKSIFGATGTGKTTFVNDASGGKLAVGHKSHACTQDVGNSPEFQVNGRKVVLFDTPGFDDTHLSDTEILKRIAGFLAQSYEKGYKLTGIIYLHRITDIRVGGISRRTFNVFRKLCGTDSLSNVLIVTNMWSDPPTQEQLDREAELRDHGDFFQPALAQGARLVRRTHKTEQSAHEILSMLIGKEATTMEIQRELVDEKKELADTGAAQVVERELRMAVEKHRKEMEQVKADMETAIRERDERTQKELEEWQAQAQAQDEKRTKELESMKKGFGEEQARWKKEIEEARARREAAEKMRQEIEEARRKQQEADAHHRHELEKRISQLQHDLNNKPGCIIA
ncbi:50S ribosome-binding GTPase [Ceratobasidium sp. AG-Ba]|nr:50S ribosome-binding GTPase [Ceratobasidium sp. AG-Ba]